MDKFNARMFNPQPEPPGQFGLAGFDPQPEPPRDPHRMAGLLLPAVQAAR